MSFSNISFLIVDDDESVLASIKTLVSRLFTDSRLFTALDGETGWKIIQEEAPSIVISDLGLPGIKGDELCKMTKAMELPISTYFIIITGFGSREQKLAALENGADDFLVKPVSPDELLARLRSASRIVQLQSQLWEENHTLRELNEELRQDFEDMVRLAISCLTARIPEAKQTLIRVTNAALWIAKNFGDFSIEEINTVRIAASLSLIGKIYLPDTLIHKPIVIDGTPTHDLMRQVPLSAQKIIGASKSFEKIGLYLRHIFENYDGSGFPDRLQTREIPIQSRLIRVTLDFEFYREYYNGSIKDAIEHLKREGKHLYDPRFITLLDEYLWTISPESLAVDSRAMQLYDLKPGMSLVRDIVTNSGMKLAPSGAVLQERMIERIIAHSTSDPILGTVYVKI